MHVLITVSSPASLQLVFPPPVITNILIRPRLCTSKAALMKVKTTFVSANGNLASWDGSRLSKEMMPFIIIKKKEKLDSRL